MLQFKNLKQLEKTLDTQEKCLDYFEANRFEEGYFCPHCEGIKFYKLSKIHTYKCASEGCRKRFNVLTGTIFENTKIPLTHWFTAIFIFTTNKKGISSIALSEYLGITQKSSWFMLHRIREMLKDKNPSMLEGEVEADTTYCGGQAKYKHESKKKKDARGRRVIEKTPVFGIVQRGGKVINKVVEAETAEHVLPIIHANVIPETIINTDEKIAYHSLHKTHEHYIINHSKKEYAKGRTFTNTIEGYFSLLKRGIVGIYHQVSPKHLGRYCDEFSFRYNYRTLEPALRFDEALRQSNSRLTYAELIKKA